MCRRRGRNRSPSRSRSRSSRSSSSNSSISSRSDSSSSECSYTSEDSYNRRRNRRRSRTRSRSLSKENRFQKEKRPKKLHPKLRQVNPSKTIGVFNIHYETKKIEIATKFEEFGKITKIFCIKDPRTKRFKGFAFITYEDIESAKKAICETEKISFQNRMVIINYSTTKKPTGALRNDYRYYKKQIKKRQERLKRSEDGGPSRAVDK